MSNPLQVVPGNNSFIQLFAPMETMSPSEIRELLKLVVRPHIINLSGLVAAPSKKLPKKKREIMRQIIPDADFICKIAPVFADKCLQEKNGAEELLWDFEKDLTQWLWLSNSFADEPDYEKFHPSLPSYLYLTKSKIRPVRKTLRIKTGYYKHVRVSKYTQRDSRTEVKAKKVKIIQNFGPAPAKPPEEFFVPYASPPEQRPGSQEKDPGMETTSMRQPPADFRLPDFLEVLPLKEEQKALFLRYLWFISTHPLPFKLRMYALLLLGLHLVLEEHFRQKKDLDPILNKLCGSTSKDHREASGFRCTYGKPKSDAKERYLLTGKYPEFEELVMSLR